ncbi:MAG: hypothetical protein KDB53_10060 [Planctomycetes bacterium]|nr:hypothetical protein [Planctomycetota bacterium]
MLPGPAKRLDLDIGGLDDALPLVLMSLDFSYWREVFSADSGVLIEPLVQDRYAMKRGPSGTWRGPVILTDDGPPATVEWPDLPVLDVSKWTVFEGQTGNAVALPRQGNGAPPGDGKNLLLVCPNFVTDPK